VVHYWLGKLIFLSLECVVARSNADNLTKVFMQALMNQGSLYKDMIYMKVMTFGTNDVYVFQGVRWSRVTK